MRLIDADKLSTKMLDASWYDNADEDVAWELLQDAPTVDLVTAPVKCGECKYFDTDECAMIGYCDGCDCKVDLGFNETGFCSHGERKDGEPHA